MSVVLREDAAGAGTAEARMEEAGAEEAGAEEAGAGEAGAGEAGADDADGSRAEVVGNVPPVIVHQPRSVEQFECTTHRPDAQTHLQETMSTSLFRNLNPTHLGYRMAQHDQATSSLQCPSRT